MRSSYRLKLIHGLPDSSYVNSTLSIEERCLKVNFEVNNPTPYFNPSFDKHSSQWGLWDFDVVEIFVSSHGSNKYFEFQLSPLSQYFELEIFEPRKKFNKNYKSHSIYESTLEENGAWTGFISIPLESIGCKEEDIIVGNMFACLGPPEKRRYFSAFLPIQEIPDFHLPQYFRPLLKD